MFGPFWKKSGSTTNLNGAVQQLAPSEKGNFITCLEYYPHFGGWLLTGYASGRLTAWKLDQDGTPASQINDDEITDDFSETLQQREKLKSLVSDNAEKRGDVCTDIHFVEVGTALQVLKKAGPLRSRARTELGPFREGEFIGRVLCRATRTINEAVRYLYVDNEKICAVIGFSRVLIWENLKSIHTPTNISEYNYRMFNMNKRIYLTAWKNIIRLYVVEMNSSKERLGPVFNLKTENLERSPTLQPLDAGTEVMCADEERLVTFQTKDDGSKELILYTLDCKTKLQSIYFPRTSKHYWGFQIHGDLIAYVSQQNVIKLYSLESEKVVARLRGHKSFLIAFQFCENLEIISLGSDRRICVWTPASKSDRKWVCTQVIKNVPGNFVPSNPYSIIRRGDRIFYHSDFGCFSVMI